MVYIANKQTFTSKFEYSAIITTIWCTNECFFYLFICVNLYFETIFKEHAYKKDNQIRFQLIWCLNTNSRLTDRRKSICFDSIILKLQLTDPMRVTCCRKRKKEQYSLVNVCMMQIISLRRNLFDGCMISGLLFVACPFFLHHIVHSWFYFQS